MKLLAFYDPQEKTYYALICGVWHFKSLFSEIFIATDCLFGIERHTEIRFF